MAQNAKGKLPTLPKQINQATSKVSKQAISFNQVTQGKCCIIYVKSAKGLSSSRFNEIMELTSGFMKTTNLIINADHEIIEIDNEEDIRANIIGISSDSDGDCKLSYTSYNDC